MNDPKTIEHIPDEKRQPWWLWWVGWAFVVVLWLSFIGDDINWTHIILGALTGGMIVAWAVDIGGAETPASWRRKSRPKR